MKVDLIINFFALILLISDLLYIDMETQLPKMENQRNYEDVE